MFDIYLSIGCRALPDMEDLAQDVPILRDTAFQQKLLTPSPKRPGFLGLDVSELLAKTLLRRLQSVRAVGFWLSSAYRQPRISREQAEVFAAQVLPEISARHFQHYPGDTLSPLFFAGEKPEYWVFKAELSNFAPEKVGECGSVSINWTVISGPARILISGKRGWKTLNGMISIPMKGLSCDAKCGQLRLALLMSFLLHGFGGLKNMPRMGA